MGWTANPGNPVKCTDNQGAYICVPRNLTCGRGFNPGKMAAKPGVGWMTMAGQLTDPYTKQVGVNLADNAVVNTTFTNYAHGDCWQVWHIDEPYFEVYV
jgi:hypothetical protein